jgi:hypothetical protein
MGAYARYRQIVERGGSTLSGGLEVSRDLRFSAERGSSITMFTVVTRVSLTSCAALASAAGMAGFRDAASGDATGGAG